MLTLFTYVDFTEHDNLVTEMCDLINYLFILLFTFIRVWRVYSHLLIFYYYLNIFFRTSLFVILFDQNIIPKN